MSQISSTPPAPPIMPTAYPLQPHRGTMVLVLGILSLVLMGGCGVGLILGIIA